MTADNGYPLFTPHVVSRDYDGLFLGYVDAFAAGDYDRCRVTARVMMDAADEADSERGNPAAKLVAECLTRFDSTNDWLHMGYGIRLACLVVGPPNIFWLISRIAGVPEFSPQKFYGRPILRSLSDFLDDFRTSIARVEERRASHRAGIAKREYWRRRSGTPYVYRPASSVGDFATGTNGSPETKEAASDAASP